MTSNIKEISHLPECAEGAREGEVCTGTISLHGEPETEQWWSGWPGAWCMKCGVDDPEELCTGSGCSCICHEAMWDAYEKLCREWDT